MRFCYGLVVALLLCGAASAQTTVVTTRRPVIVTAQDHAYYLARRGTLVHSSCGTTEGIGTGVTVEQARRNCCFFGTRQIAEEGVAYSPITRRWYAVIRYR